MSQLRGGRKRPLPFMAMGITVPIGMTHKYPLPKVPRFQVRLASQEATNSQRPIQVDGLQGD